MEDSIIKFKCPQCGQPLAVRKPESGLGASLTCPRCGKAISLKVRERAVRLPGQERPQAGVAHLLMVEGPQADRSAFPLRPGSNIVGRDDEDTLQDIALRGDMTVSRRSVDIEVGPAAGGGRPYRLQVLNAKNPVLVNGTPLRVGQSTSLRVGDVVQLGATKLMLKL